MSSLILLCVIAMSVPVATHQFSYNFSLINKCTNTYVTSAPELRTTTIKFQTEAEISKAGNYFGLTPQSYNLKLSFINATHYNGAVAIAVLVANFTRRIAVNIDLDSIKYDLGNTMIEADFSDVTPTHNCIEKSDYDNTTKTLVIDLETHLWKGYRYIIHFKNFQAHAYDVKSQTGAIGLQKSICKDFGAVYTNFAPNNARTVFPCIDHMTLRAKFQLCMEYDTGYTVASTTAVVRETKQASTDRWTKCFEETKHIPTYVFSFALMINYMTQEYEGDINLVVFTPPRYINHVSLMAKHASNAVEYMQHITNRYLPFGKLQLLILFVNATVSTNNAGLIPVPGEQVLANVESSHFYKGFFRAIVNQWLGPITTVSHWGEVCLQEGLAEYFNWFLLEQHCNQSIVAKANAISKLQNVPKEFWVIDDFNGILTTDELKKCYSFPPLFYNIVAQFYGISVLERYLQILLDRKTYGFAGIDDWEALFYLSIAADWRPMAGFISGWFKRGGRITLKIAYNGFTISCECISYNDQNCNVVVPFHIHTSLRDDPFELILRDGRGSVGLPDKPKWIYVEPKGTEFMVKLYNMSNYETIFRKINSNSLTISHLQGSYKSEILDGFCDALMSNHLPIETVGDIMKWKSVFRYGVQLNANCSCCLVPVGTIRFCDYVEQCDSVNLLNRIRKLDSTVRVNNEVFLAM